MGGEGSAMAANTSLKNNRSMLKKRRETSSLGGSYSGVELKEFPEATEVQIREIKDKIQKENKETRKKQILLFSFLLFVVIILFWYLIN